MSHDLHHAQAAGSDDTAELPPGTCIAVQLDARGGRLHDWLNRKVTGVMSRLPLSSISRCIEPSSEGAYTTKPKKQTTLPATATSSTGLQQINLRHPADFASLCAGSPNTLAQLARAAAAAAAAGDRRSPNGGRASPTVGVFKPQEGHHPSRVTSGHNSLDVRLLHSPPV